MVKDLVWISHALFDPFLDQMTPRKVVMKLQSLKTACRRKVIIPNEIKMIVDEQPELLQEVNYSSLSDPKDYFLVIGRLSR
jgi:hypothetical protein